MVSDKCCDWWQGVHSSLSIGLGCFRVAMVGACWLNRQVNNPGEYDDSYSFFAWPLTFKRRHSSSQDLIHQQDVAGNHRAVKEMNNLLRNWWQNNSSCTDCKCQISPWMKELLLYAVIVPYTCFSCHHGLPWKITSKKLNYNTCGWMSLQSHRVDFNRLNSCTTWLLNPLGVSANRFRPVLRSTPTSWPDSLNSVCSFSNVSCGS